MQKKTHLQEFEDYLRSDEKSDKTIQAYMIAMEQFYSVINKKPMDITKDDIYQFKQWISKKSKSSNSLIVKYGAVKKYLIFLEIIKGKVILTERETKILLKSPTMKYPVRDPLTKDEVNQFLGVITKPRDKAIFLTMFYSCQRIGDILKLRIEDVDFEAQTVFIQAPKNKMPHTSKINQVVIDAIKEHLKTRTPPKPGYEKYLFLNESGRELDPKYIWKITQAYGYRAGITKHVFPHLIGRHTPFTLMDEGGMSPSQILVQSGHKNPDTLLKVYIKPNREFVNRRVDDALSLTKKSEEKKPEITPKSNTDYYCQ